jgi:Tn7-like transposition protein D/TniQ
MIVALPTPFPGELLYSLFARYRDRMQYASKRSIVQDLFGSGNVIASVWLPSRLDEFVATLPPGYRSSADDMIDNHTLLPFYAPFISPERLRQLRQDMHGRNGPGIHMRLGTMASRIPLPEWLRLCPRCVQEDRTRYGECYWHRVHQVSGVEICPFHEVYLQDTNVHARNKKTRHEFVSAECAARGVAQQQPDSRSPYHQTLLHIARDAYWLLCQRNLSQNLTLLHHRYRQLLFEIDLVTYRGRVDINMFLQKFRHYYPSQLLHLLHCGLEDHIQESWLLRLVRTPHGCAQHPLYHLLLMHFLGYTAEEFFSIPTVNTPFGAGPWPCLNPTCDHYRQLHIRECRIAHSQYVSGKPIGTFICMCGFTYSRTGPDTTADKQFQRNKITAFGSIWESRLQTLWEDKTASLRAIARQLGVDPLTVKRQAARIGLPFPRPVRRCLPPKTPEKTSLPLAQASERAALETYRAIWLATIQEHPKAGVKILRSRVPGAYSWLYKNDKMWLQMHTPLCKKPKPQPHRIDWGKRDLRLAEEVREAGLLLKNLSEHPVHITVSAIGREIGQLALLQQHLDKLPRTAGALREFVETREAFAVRRVMWIAQVCHRDHMLLTRWELVRKAGVERVVLLPFVKEAIETALNLLNQSTQWSE